MAGDTLQNILECGKREFLEKGFEGASLRAIAKAAGVTTGAIYGYFSDKRALFDALVSEAAKGFLDQFMYSQQKFAALPEEKQALEMIPSSNENMAWVVEYIYRYYDVFKLLVCCSAGTEYEGYMHKMVEIETQATLHFINAVGRAGCKVQKVDEQLIHILSNSFFSGIFEIVVHDMEKEKAVAYVQSLKEFYIAGWVRILGL